MNIQFDPFASALAVLALVVSVRAYYLATKAPLKERTRANRDQIRSALLAAQKTFFKATYALDRGEDIQDRPEEVEAAMTILQDLSMRLPSPTEQADLSMINARLQGVWGAWQSVEHAQRGVAFHKRAVREWEEKDGEGADSFRRKTLAEYRDKLDSNIRTRDASRIALREALNQSNDLISKYVRQANRHDSNEVDPS